MYSLFGVCCHPDSEVYSRVGDIGHMSYFGQIRMARRLFSCVWLYTHAPELLEIPRILLIIYLCPSFHHGAQGSVHRPLSWSDQTQICSASARRRHHKPYSELSSSSSSQYVSCYSGPLTFQWACSKICATFVFCRYSNVRGYHRSQGKPNTTKHCRISLGSFKENIRIYSGNQEHMEIFFCSLCWVL